MSPCGDKLQYINQIVQTSGQQFPSPYGDKLQYQIKGFFKDSCGFPSPCGDKLKSVTTSAFVGLICFRPLMEDNFTIPHIEPKEKNHPQEKHGWSRKDKP